uniref:Putative secreted protein n=1 Tax=Ixodes ricinus TaxID=34613 RepID=A0A6B0UQG7_IXORI
MGDAAAGIVCGAGFTLGRWWVGAACAAEAPLQKRSCDDVRARAWLDDGKLAGWGGSIETMGGDGDGSRNPGGGTGPDGWNRGCPHVWQRFMGLEGLRASRGMAPSIIPGPWMPGLSGLEEFGEGL